MRVLARTTWDIWLSLWELIGTYGQIIVAFSLLVLIIMTLTLATLVVLELELIEYILDLQRPSPYADDHPTQNIPPLIEPSNR